VSKRKVRGQPVVGLVRFAARRRAALPTWANRILDGVRGRLPERWVAALTGRSIPRSQWDPPEAHVRPAAPSAAVRLLIGPANHAGQGDAWARAVEREIPDVGAVSFALVRPGGFGFQQDYGVSPLVYRVNRRWQRDQFDYLTAGFTHVITEVGRPICGWLHDGDPFREAAVLRKAGLRVAMLSHGSDSRLPRRHAEREEWSPFRDDDWTDIPRLQQQAEQFVERLGEFPGPVFVSTPDLLDDLPFATWCPVVVDVSMWGSDAPLVEHDRPVVVHAPSHDRIKGTDLVDAAMAPLVARGLIEYRRIGRVPYREMPAVYRDADVVLDQFRIGSYGVAACEAMAAGRAVIGNVSATVRERVSQQTGLELPVVQATPATLADVVERVVEDRAEAAAAGSAGRAFVESAHTGRASAAALRTFLGSE